MTEKYYIDACIWRDLYENRVDKYRPLGEWAFEFFRMIKETKSIALYSDLVIKELATAYNQEKIKEMFKIVEEAGCLKKVEIKREQIKETIKIKREKRLPFNDLLHSILARDNDAIMVTRDRHFEQFEDIVTIRKPEDLF